MAFLSLSSTYKDFSYQIRKNPDTGMIGKKMKLGTAFGYYSSPNQYNIIFFDDNDEVSFKKYPDMQFEYIDSSRYNSPLFIINALRLFFNSPLQENDQILSSYKMNVACVEIKKKKLFDRFLSYFPNYKCIIEKLDNKEYYTNYSLNIEHLSCSLYEFLNFTFLLSYFITITNGIEIDINTDIVKRLIKAANHG